MGTIRVTHHLVGVIVRSSTVHRPIRIDRLPPHHQPLLEEQAATETAGTPVISAPARVGPRIVACRNANEGSSGAAKNGGGSLITNRNRTHCVRLLKDVTSIGCRLMRRSATLKGSNQASVCLVRRFLPPSIRSGRSRKWLNRDGRRVL